MDSAQQSVLQVPMADIVTLIIAVAIGTAILVWLFVQPVIDRLKADLAEREADWDDYDFVSERARELKTHEHDEIEAIAQAIGWGQ